MSTCAKEDAFVGDDRGTFSVQAEAATAEGHPADTFLSTRGGWSKVRRFLDMSQTSLPQACARRSCSNTVCKHANYWVC